MIRQAIKLAIDAFRWEFNAWLKPEPAGAAPVAVPVDLTSESSTANFIERVKQDKNCYRCAKPKLFGCVLCPECQDENAKAMARSARGAA